MQADIQTPVTELLAQARAGRAGAWQAAFSAVYEELKRVARGQLRGQRETLQTTALVHEAYVKLSGGSQLALADRNHLLALSARAMRQVLVDHARQAQAQKRGEGQRLLTLTGAHLQASGAEVEVLELDALLEALQKIDPRAAQIVELRYFGGYEEREIATMLEISERTVRRDWRRGRAFLLAELGA
jgi:RNA polymerase sigma factor (TIGR02999 family)